MITFRTFLATAAVLLTSSACLDDANSVTAPERVDFNTGHTFGGGNRTDSTTMTTASSGAAEVPPDTTGAATGRGGGFIGYGH
jgi:hypothetical protein